MGNMWEENAKDGGAACLGSSQGNTSWGAVSLEVARNVAASFSALSRSCWFSKSALLY